MKPPLVCHAAAGPRAVLVLVVTTSVPVGGTAGLQPSAYQDLHLQNEMRHCTCARCPLVMPAPVDAPERPRSCFLQRTVKMKSGPVSLCSARCGIRSCLLVQCPTRSQVLPARAVPDAEAHVELVRCTWGEALVVVWANGTPPKSLGLPLPTTVLL